MDSDELHDCTGLLTEQLALVRRQIHETLDGPTRLVPCDLAHRELCDRAALHAQARDEIVLPVVRRAGHAGAVATIIGQQQCLKDALAMCLIRPTSHPQWREALEAFLTAVQQQMAGDVTLLGPLLKEATDATQRRLLCERLQERFDRLAPHRHSNAHLRLAKSIWPVQSPDRMRVGTKPTRLPDPPPRDAAFSP
ncbi:hypothetical protein [Roseateles asaccharophilus]|uniref:Hemerythrin-like domain-containing protein n=1 Tax=Roseateles asaccharophilus TaxID=582607 RepID=A0ABU2A698_9BURK|nr:hypothetical protein [Roseateles asaccharophilus]MDR7332723.1 hypothetical protein [Roseateles asaccharophilus]